MPDLHLASADDAALRAEREAHQRVQDAQQRQRLARRELRGLERGLAAILSSPSVTAAQRAEFIGLLAGSRRQQIDPGLTSGLIALSHTEERLVQIHRELSRGAKAVLSGVATALAERDQLRQENETLRRKGKRGRA
jgi:hypothetical protein